jgi:ribonucleoside-triphosphate reductase
VNIAEKITSLKVMKKLISAVIKEGVQYFAINYFFNKCENSHITVGSEDICSVCGGSVVEHYTRIVGFLTPVSSWQEDRRNEFKERIRYSINS